MSETATLPRTTTHRIAAGEYIVWVRGIDHPYKLYKVEHDRIGQSGRWGIDRFWGASAPNGDAFGLDADTKAECIERIQKHAQRWLTRAGA